MRSAVHLPCLLTLLLAGGALSAVYVDQYAPGPGHDGASWDTALLTILDGVDVAYPDGEVWVADGVYPETLFMLDGVAVYGGFRGAEPGGYETALDQRDPLHNTSVIDGRGLSMGVLMAPRTRLDGFVVTHCGASAIYCESVGEDAVVTGNVIVENTSEYGAAIMCMHSASPTITANTIAGNYASYYGGGIYCSHSCSPTISENCIVDNACHYGDGGGIFCYDHSSPTIAHNELTGNRAIYYSDGGAICCIGYSSPDVIGNAIVGNAAQYGSGVLFSDHSDALVSGNLIARNSYAYQSGGGGIYCSNSSPLIVRNTIVENAVTGSGGGVYCEGASSPVVSGNTVADNDAAYGAGISVLECAPFVFGNAISGNLARRGGAIWASVRSRCALANNSMVGNDAEESGGAVYTRSSDFLIANNIVAGNSAAEGGGIWCASDVTPSLVCNNVWSNQPEDYWNCEPGYGDISADPMLADPEVGDLHLLAGSPCIDAGENDAYPMGYQDPDGDPRICDGDGDAVARVDIGADEWRAECELNAAPEGWFVPGWVWFSIPLEPRGSSDASGVLGFDCTNRLFGWDDSLKIYELYPDDFTELAVGPGYAACLAAGEAYVPVYEGAQPHLPFERSLPAAGWSWVGVPSTQDIHGLDLLLAKDGEMRTPAEDRDGADPWLNWNWIFWYPELQTAGIMDPFGSGDDVWLHPWFGYRVWANTERVSLIFP